MGFRFLHLADCHLETRFGGRPRTRERLRRATREAFERAVDHALANRLHALLVAGDLYDDPVLSLRSELEIGRQVRRLTDAGVWFLYACGNHDPGARRAASLGIESERAHVFRDAAPRAVRVLDGAGEPVGLVVGAGHAEDAEGENLAARFPDADPALPTVGLLHTNVSGARASEQHDRYAPSGEVDYQRHACAPAYAYWALGHVHIRQRAVAGLPVYYAGNLQGRNPRETGEKGGLLVEAHAGGAAEPEFVRFAPVRWERLRVDDLPAARADAGGLCDHLARRIDALRRDADEELVACVELAGPTPLAPQLRRSAELDALAGELEERTGVLEVQLRDAGVALPVDRDRLRSSPTVAAEALALIERARDDAGLLEELAPEALANELAGDPAARLAYLRSLLDELPEELIERSLAEAGA